jgi:uncharacterized repeat protein (TIGR01451 family)
MSAPRRKDAADGPSRPSAAPRRRRPRGPLALVSLLFVLFLGIGQITTIAAAEELSNEPAATETETPAPDGGDTQASTDPTEAPAPSESPDATSDSTESTTTGDDSTGSAESTEEGSTPSADTTDQESSSAGHSSGTGAVTATQTDEPGPASGDGVQPSLIPGNPTCTDAMGEGAFLFSTKVEPVTDTTVQLSNDGMTGTLTVDVNEGAQTVSFTFSGDFVALGVIVKGGNNANFYDYRPDGDPHDTGLHSPVNPMNGKFYGLSHLEFCIGEGQATETHAHIDVQKSCPDSVQAGSDVEFTITVTNTGTDVLTDITVDDSLKGDITDDFDVDLSAGLAVGASATATVTYTPGSDEDPVENTVTATAKGAESDEDASDSASCSTDVQHQTEIDVEKSCPDTVEAGSDVEFTITVTNTGTEALTDITVDDSLKGDITDDFDVDLSAGLAVGASATATVTYTPGSDEDPVENTVTATGTGVDSQATDSDTATCETDVLPPTEGPAIQVVKGSDLPLIHRGETITYTFEVTNTGDVELFDVDLTDPRCDTGTIQAGVDVDSSLAVGEVWHFTCTHLVTDADPIQIPNTVTVRGDTQQGEGGTEVTDTDSHVVVVITPDIQIDKSVSDVSVTPGATVTYTYVVTNTGDTTLFDISVDDDVLGHIGDIPMLGVNASQTLTATFTVGSSPVTNTGTASGQDVLGKTVTDSDIISVTVVSGGGTGSGGGVLGGGGSAGGTAFTGSDVWTWAAIAAALALIGAVVLAATRRGRRAEGSIE